jgi:hypothetical protein
MGILSSKSSTATVDFSTPQEIVINKADDSIEAWQGGDWLVEVDGGATAEKQDEALAELQSLNAMDFASEQTLEAVFNEIESGNLSLESIDAKTPSLAYATQVDEASSTVTYVGKAAVGTATSVASWQISKITITGSVTAITFADGNANFDNEWDDRASLSYS